MAILLRLGDCVYLDTGHVREYAGADDRGECVYHSPDGGIGAEFDAIERGLYVWHVFECITAKLGRTAV